MTDGNFFTIDFPRLDTSVSDPVNPPIADGCESNTNYYTQGVNRGTCCCSCDSN